MNESGIAEQVISRPFGGGVIKGMGESFSPDLHAGTGNLSVPLGRFFEGQRYPSSDRDRRVRAACDKEERPWLPSTNPK